MQSATIAQLEANGYYDPEPTPSSTSRNSRQSVNGLRNSLIQSLTRASIFRFSDSALQSVPDALTASRYPVAPGFLCAVTTFNDPEKIKHSLETDYERGETPEDSLQKRFWAMNVATQDRLQSTQRAWPLPEEQGSRFIRYGRYHVFSVYMRIFTFICMANFIAVVVFLTQLQKYPGIETYSNAATAASANFCVGVLFRNEHVVNLIFRMCCNLPLWFPLAIRRRAAKVYSYGGIHSGCNISGTVWYFIFCILVINNFQAGSAAESALAATTGVTLVMLVLIIAFAHPDIRARMHDQFEAVHRYAGWTVFGALWTQELVLVAVLGYIQMVSFGLSLIRSPPFWFLGIITFCIIYPWTRLRYRNVRVEYLSKHATRLHFDYTDLGGCLGVRLTDAPLKETHGFATIPNYKGTPGFSVIISNAGDWTNKIITNPPEKLYVKGVPTLGVIRCAFLFCKVVVIGTGSGIGPCLSLLQSHPDFPMRVIWSAQVPESTYGVGIMKAVFRADPEAIIVDTRKTGRGNLLALAYSVFKESDCEAVIIISNPSVTKKVVYGLETRGIPAFGPIFDS